MSKLKTSIAVDLESITKRLPAGAYVHGIEWDAEARQVSVVWESDTIRTGFDFPVEYPVEKLQEISDSRLEISEPPMCPAEISDSRLEISEAAEPVPTEAEKTPEPKRKRR